MNTLARIGTTLTRSAHIVLFGVLLVAGAGFAFTQPTGTPPANNVPAPINTGATAQSKAGNFAAAALAGTNVLGANKVISQNQFCFRNGQEDDCITEWPGGGGGTQGATPECSIQVRTVEAIYPHSDNLYGIAQATGSATGLAGVGSICWGSLNSDARAEGWVPVSFDRCPNVSGRDCNDNVAYCTYMRLQCTNFELNEGSYDGVHADRSDITRGDGNTGGSGGGGSGGGGNQVEF